MCQGGVGREEGWGSVVYGCVWLCEALGGFWGEGGGVFRGGESFS